MNTQFACKLSRGVVARSLGLSISRFSYLFKTQTGLTPAQYLKSVRISKAKELIEATDLSLKEISILVGLDRSHLGRDFANRFGLRPSKFRSANSR